jgi:hypothetical protein
MPSHEAATAAPQQRSDKRPDLKPEAANEHPVNVSDGALRKMQTEAISRPEKSRVAEETTNKKTEWTLAVSLNTTIDQFGGRSKLEKLQSLAEKTRGVPVAIVAQFSKELDGSDGSGLNQSVEHYVIRDGKVKNIGGSFPSKGFGQEVTDLLSTANREAPSQKLGLWIQSHGGATAGLTGDNGRLSLDDLNKAISKGLKGSWHAKLDLLNFDSCLMGHTKVIDKMSSRASRIVASSETEAYVPGTPIDGQNVKSAVAFLLEHPNISGASFAKAIVDQASAGVNSDSKSFWEGTETLAHFDTKKAPEFFSSLNDLGFALAKAIKDGNPRQIEAIQSAISHAPSLPIFPMRSQSSDLKSFIDNISKASDDGSITEPSVKSAVDRVRSTQKDLTPGFHGGTLYDKQGGLAAYLPDLNFDLTDKGHSNQVLTPGLEIALKELHYENRERIGELMRNEITRMQGILGPQSGEELFKLRLDNKRMYRANDEPEFRRAKAALNLRIRSLAGLELGHNLKSAAQNTALQRSVRENLPVPGWQEFVEALNHKP